MGPPGSTPAIAARPQKVVFAQRIAGTLIGYVALQLGPTTTSDTSSAGPSMCRRGLEPPRGSPGPGAQPGSPDVICVQMVQPVGRYGRIGRSGCCHGCCHELLDLHQPIWKRMPARAASCQLPGDLRSRRRPRTPQGGSRRLPDGARVPDSGGSGTRHDDELGAWLGGLSFTCPHPRSIR